MTALLLLYCLARFRSSLDRIALNLLPASLLGLMILSAGCGRDEVTTTLADDSTPSEAIAVRPAPTQSVAAKAGISDSPAAQSLSPDPATTSPESVCRAFMQRLQNGDRIGAENLLTRAALTTTHRANLELEPVSIPDAQMTVHTARYASQLERSAEVDCEITETVDGQTAPVTLTWQVVRQSSGWRVCGMVVPLGVAGQSRLLSFESIDDVATIKLLAAGEEIAESEANQQMRQAEANEPDTSLQ